MNTMLTMANDEWHLKILFLSTHALFHIFEKLSNIFYVFALDEKYLSI